MDLTARLVAASQKRDEAKALISKEDELEQEQRSQLATIEKERVAAEFAARELNLERRIDLAVDALGAGARLKGVLIQSFPDSFVVKGDGVAHSKWRRTIESNATSEAKGRKGGVSNMDANRQYAIDCIYDWNGITDFGVENQNGAKLIAYLQANPGLVTPITDAALVLNGVLAEERKSDT